jgi:hypothetical protein
MDIDVLLRDHSGAISTLLIGFFGIVLTVVQISSAISSHRQTQDANGTQMVFSLWEDHGTDLLRGRDSIADAISELAPLPDAAGDDDELVARIKYFATMVAIGRSVRVIDVVSKCTEKGACNMQAACYTFGVDIQDFLIKVPVFRDYVNAKMGITDSRFKHWHQTFKVLNSMCTQNQG